MTVEDQLRARLRGKVVVVGVGNPMSGDDSAGCLVARKMEQSDSLRVIDAEEVPESMIGKIVGERPDTIVLVDAVDMGAGPGDVAIVEGDQITRYNPTTHRVPLGLVIDVLRRMCGADTFLVAIQPGSLGFGILPSREVEQSAALVAALLEESMVSASRRESRP